MHPNGPILLRRSVKRGKIIDDGVKRGVMWSEPDEKEQFVVAGVDMSELPAGTKLAIVETLMLEVGEPKQDVSRNGAAKRIWTP